MGDWRDVNICFNGSRDRRPTGSDSGTVLATTKNAAGDGMTSPSEFSLRKFSSKIQHLGLKMPNFGGILGQN